MRSRGQSLVEFALVAPLFLVILFGVVEYALINASIGSFNFAAKEAARYEAIIGRGNPPKPFDATPLDQYIANSVISPQVQGVVMAQAQEIVVYDSLETGGCSGTGTITGAVPTCQFQAVLKPSGGTWTITSSNWQPNLRNDQLSNADYVGVFIEYQYTYLTAFFAITSPTITLSAISVQRIEPQQYGDRDHSPPIASVGGGQSWNSATPFSSRQAGSNLVLVLPRHESGLIAGERA
jgi:Flp pilus assembly protein TadG